MGDVDARHRVHGDVGPRADRRRRHGRRLPAVRQRRFRRDRSDDERASGAAEDHCIHGDRGTAVIEQEDILRWEFQSPVPGDEAIKKRFAQKIRRVGGAADPKSISHQGHARQLADFVQAIQSNGSPHVDGREGRKAFALICAIYESMCRGRTVPINHYR